MSSNRSTSSGGGSGGANPAQTNMNNNNEESEIVDIDEDDSELSPPSPLVRQASLGAEIECKVCNVCQEKVLSKFGHLRLKCRCLLHFKCLIRYIRSKTSFEIVKDGGIKCPNFLLKACAFRPGPYYILPHDLNSLVDYQNSPQKKPPAAADEKDRENGNGVNEDGDDLLESPFTKEECTKIQAWIADAELDKKQGFRPQSSPYIQATSKQCPKCKFAVTHFLGHDCHHIRGCPSCNEQWCYQCGQGETENEKNRHNKAKCICPAGGWTTFCECSQRTGEFIILDPYPHDSRCGCPVCPDCRPGKPCGTCSGNCAVCRDYIKHGPSTLLDISESSVLSQAQIDKWPVVAKEVIKKQQGNEMINAVASGKLQNLIKLLANPLADVNFVSPDKKNTALCVAITKNDLPIFTHLLTHPNIDVNAKNFAGQSAIMLALQFGRIGMFEHLFSLPTCDINLTLKDGSNCLRIAVEKSSSDWDCFKGIISRLLNRMNETSINFVNPEGRTVLVSALLAENSEELVNVLLENNTWNLDIIDKSGSSALMHACAKANIMLFRKIIDIHTSFGTIVNVNLKNSLGRTALSYCAESDFVEGFVCLLDSKYNADINVFDSKGRTPLHFAINSRRSTIANILLDRSDIKYTACDGEGASPFLLSCSCGLVDVAQRLLDRFKDLHETSNSKAVRYAILEKNPNHASAFICAKEHPLEMLFIADRAPSCFCDKCGEKVFSGRNICTFYCLECNFDICMKCLIPPILGNKSEVGDASADAASVPNEDVAEPPLEKVIVELIRSKYSLDDLIQILTSLDPYIEEVFADEKLLFFFMGGGQQLVLEYLLNNTNVAPASSTSSLRETAAEVLSQQPDFKDLPDDKFSQINCVDSFNLTPLYYASLNNHLEIVKILLDQVETDVNLGNTLPLHAALQNKHENVANYLLKMNKHVDYQWKYISNNSTPLLLSCKNRMSSTAKILLKKKDIDINLANSQGETALLCAVENHMTDIVYDLLSRPEIDVYHSDNTGSTAIIHAVVSGNVSLLDTFCKYTNFDVNHKNLKGETLLMHAATCGNAEIFDKVVSLPGLDFSASDKKGMGALIHAVTSLESTTVYCPGQHARTKSSINASETCEVNCNICGSVSRLHCKLCSYSVCDECTYAECIDITLPSANPNLKSFGGLYVKRYIHGDNSRHSYEFIRNDHFDERLRWSTERKTWVFSRGAEILSYFEYCSPEDSKDEDKNYKNGDDDGSFRDLESVFLRFGDESGRWCLDNPLDSIALSKDEATSKLTMDAPKFKFQNNLSFTLHAIKKLLAIPDMRIYRLDGQNFNFFGYISQCSNFVFSKILNVVVGNPAVDLNKSFIVNYAVVNGNADFVSHFLEKYVKTSLADIDINRANESSNLLINSTALILAVKQVNFEMVKLILQFPNINLLACDKLGMNAMSYAIENLSLDIIDLFMSHTTFDITKRDSSGMSMLMIAAKHSRIDVVRKILSLYPHLDVNLTNNEGMSALTQIVFNFKSKYFRCPSGHFLSIVQPKASVKLGGGSISPADNSISDNSQQKPTLNSSVGFKVGATSDIQKVITRTNGKTPSNRQSTLEKILSGNFDANSAGPNKGRVLDTSREEHLFCTTCSYSRCSVCERGEMFRDLTADEDSKKAAMVVLFLTEFPTVDTSLRDRFGYSAIEYAVMFGGSETFQVLLKHEDSRKNSIFAQKSYSFSFFQPFLPVDANSVSLSSAVLSANDVSTTTNSVPVMSTQEEVASSADIVLNPVTCELCTNSEMSKVNLKCTPDILFIALERSFWRSQTSTDQLKISLKNNKIVAALLARFCDSSKDSSVDLFTTNAFETSTSSGTLNSVVSSDNSSYLSAATSATISSSSSSLSSLSSSSSSSLPSCDAEMPLYDDVTAAFLAAVITRQKPQAAHALSLLVAKIRGVDEAESKVNHTAFGLSIIGMSCFFTLLKIHADDEKIMTLCMACIIPICRSTDNYQTSSSANISILGEMGICPFISETLTKYGGDASMAAHGADAIRGMATTIGHLQDNMVYRRQLCTTGATQQMLRLVSLHKTERPVVFGAVRALINVSQEPSNRRFFQAAGTEVIFGDALDHHRLDVAFLNDILTALKLVWPDRANIVTLPWGVVNSLHALLSDYASKLRVGDSSQVPRDRSFDASKRNIRTGKYKESQIGQQNDSLHYMYYCDQDPASCSCGRCPSGAICGSCRCPCKSCFSLFERRVLCRNSEGRFLKRVATVSSAFISQGAYLSREGIYFCGEVFPVVNAAEEVKGSLGNSISTGTSTCSSSGSLCASCKIYNADLKKLQIDKTFELFLKIFSYLLENQNYSFITKLENYRRLESVGFMDVIQNLADDVDTVPPHIRMTIRHSPFWKALVQFKCPADSSRGGKGGGRAPPSCPKKHRMRRDFANKSLGKCGYCTSPIHDKTSAQTALLSPSVLFQAFRCTECDFEMCMSCFYHLNNDLPTNIKTGGDRRGLEGVTDTAETALAADVAICGGGSERVGDSIATSALPSEVMNNGDSRVEIGSENGKEYEIESKSIVSVQCGRRHHCVVSSHSENLYASGWNCNICKGKSSILGPERWFCRTCSYDICLNCVSREKVVLQEDSSLASAINMSTIEVDSVPSLPRHLHETDQLGMWRIKSSPARTGSVNWKDSPNNSNILFHFNPRPSNGVIVMNSFLNDEWGGEEIIRLPQLADGEALAVEIKVSRLGFEIFSRDELLHVYCHRMSWRSFDASRPVVALVQSFQSQEQIDQSWEISKV